jgi:hypothetical protein
MKANLLKNFVPGLVGITLSVVGASMSAAPLTWFPGPAMDYPGSAAATVVMPGLGNVVIAGTTAYPEGLVATNINWTPLGQPFYGNIAPGAVASGGAIIVYGGNDGVSSVSTVINYSPSDGSSTLASMNVPRSYLGYAPDRNGNAYAFGGLDDSGSPLASAERYNRGNNTWSAIAGLPAARYDFPAAFNRTNYIYIFGGLTDTTSGIESASVLRYSVSSNIWTAMASMPLAVAGSAATLGPDGKFYVVGGTSGGVPTNVVQVYNPAANSWTLSTLLPEDLSGSAMGVDSLGRLIVMGGTDTNGYDTGDVWRSQRLNAPDSPPTLTQFPTNGSATYQNLYTSIISATGNPQPAYSLVSGPDGMAVDYFSGAITWKPQGLNQIGPIPVTIQATNYAGVTNWSFTITVPNPPPQGPTNIYLVSVTETNVTLAMDPESPVFGAVTFNAFTTTVTHSPKGSGATVTYHLMASSSTTNLVISNLKPGTAYGFSLNATGPGGKSGYVGFSATTLPAPVPTNFRVTGLTSTTTTLVWDAPVGPVPVVSYDIIGVFNGIFVQYPLNYLNIQGTTYTITGLAPGTAMLWGVCAYDAYGNLSAYTYLPSLVVNPVPKSAALAAVVAPPTPTGGFQFAVQASAVQTTLVQATTNLGDPTSWVTIATNSPGNAFIFTDTNSGQFPTRYYRVISP